MSTVVKIAERQVSKEEILSELEKQIREFDFSKPPQTLIGDLIFYAGWLLNLQNPTGGETDLAEAVVRDLAARPAKKDTLYGVLLDALVHAKQAQLEGVL
jgi:hypothetical protein